MIAVTARVTIDAGKSTRFRSVLSDRQGWIGLGDYKPNWIRAAKAGEARRCTSPAAARRSRPPPRPGSNTRVTQFAPTVGPY